MIRLAVPSIDEEDVQAVAEVLSSGYLVQGPSVADFERRIAEHVGLAHGVAVSNCTAALHLALLALDVGPGGRVAVTTYSWPATANVIALCGAEPVFVDIDPITFNMDAERLADALRGHRVDAVLPVHAFGGMADMPRILAVAAEHGVPVVEDAACALGAHIGGRSAGAWGVMGCFSFHPRKAITTGEGGVVTTADARHARTLRILRNHGQDPDAPSPDFVLPGYNLRLTEFQASLGTSQMRKLEALVDARCRAAAVYDRLLADTCVRAPRAMEGSRHVYQSYVVLLPSDATPRRDDAIAALRQQGIEATIGTYHMPLTTYFRTRYGVRPGDFPVTDDVAGRAVSLPLHQSLRVEEQERVVAALLALL
jgi:perosamine synthetase